MQCSVKQFLGNMFFGFCRGMCAMTDQPPTKHDKLGTPEGEQKSHFSKVPLNWLQVVASGKYTWYSSLPIIAQELVSRQI